ncbi:MAG: NADH-ubiquinone oxidoreductase chain D, partial [uncultured Gemmatimonadetes bacterium]
VQQAAQSRLQRHPQPRAFGRGLARARAHRAHRGRGGARAGGHRGRAHAHQHRAPAPRHARRAPPGAGAGRRDRRPLHPAHRLPALVVREAGRVPGLEPGGSPHRPHGLPGAADLQLRLRHVGGEADGRGGHRALQGGAPHLHGAGPHLQPPPVAGDHGHRPGRLHGLPLHLPAARADLRPARVVHGRAHHHLVHAHRGDDGRPARRVDRPAQQVDRRVPPRAGRGGHPAHEQRHLDRPHAGRGHHLGRGRGQLRALGPQPARLGGVVRRAQGPSVLRHGLVRLRRAGGRARRHLRPLPVPDGGDEAERSPPPPDDPAPPGRPHQRRRPARHPSAQDGGDERHGVDDPPLQGGDGGRARPRGRVVVLGGVVEGRAGDVRGLGRGEQAGALARARPVVHQHRGASAHDRGGAALRRDRGERVAGHRAGGDRPM